MRHLALHTLAFWGAAHAASAATLPRFALTPLSIPGATNAEANALNDAGVIVGSASNGGFILRDGVVTTLPPPTSGSTAIPTAITARGAVTGVYLGFQSTIGFLWQNGAYSDALNIVLSEGTGNFASFLAMNAHGAIAYNTETGAQQITAYAGTPPNVAVQSIAGTTLRLTGLNALGSLLGEAAQPSGNNSNPAIYAKLHGSWRAILPPGATSSAAGLLNDRDMVAGVYVPSGAQHTTLFLRDGATYRIIPFPTGTTLCQPFGFNDVGRILGSCQTATQTRLFWYNGSTITLFGHFAAGDYVSGALNNRNRFVVTDWHAGATVAYKGVCAGAGC